MTLLWSFVGISGNVDTLCMLTRHALQYETLLRLFVVNSLKPFVIELTRDKTPGSFTAALASHFHYIMLGDVISYSIMSLMVP